MIVASIVILFLVAGLLISLKRIRPARWLAATAILILLAFTTGFVPGVMLRGLITHPQLRNAPWTADNIILVLGGGLVRWPDGSYRCNVLEYARLYETLRLYGKCRTAGVGRCRIMASGGTPWGTAVSEAEAIRAELVTLGANVADVILEDQSNNTFQNARRSAELLASLDPRLVLLVTSGIHLERARRYLKHFGREVLPAPSDALTQMFGLVPNAYNLLLAEIALHECLGLWKLALYDALGLNPESSAPGQRVTSL